MDPIYGDPTSTEALHQAHIETADVFIACSPHDEKNLVACVVAKSQGADLNSETHWGAGDDVENYDPWLNYTQNAYLGPKTNNDETGVLAKTMQVKDAAKKTDAKGKVSLSAWKSVRLSNPFTVKTSNR